MVRYGNGHPLGIMGAVTEATTPLLHLKWFMEMQGQSSKKRFIINGILFAIGFFVFRIAAGTWCSAKFVYGQNHVLATLGPVQQYTFIFTYGVALGLQYYWYYKIVNILVYKFNKFNKGPPKKSAGNNDDKTTLTKAVEGGKTKSS